MVSPDSSPASGTATAIVVDGHVHVHDCFDLPRFLESAAGRLGDVALPFPAESRACVLMLTECAHEHFFEDARRRLDERGDGCPAGDGTPFRLQGTEEAESLLLVDGDRRLHLVAGCQVASSDGLEVLMLATDRRVEDGLTMRRTLERAVDAGGFRVIPWGVGKWWGRRGRLLWELVEEFGDRGLFLGDESGRPWFWRRPKLFDLAAAEGVRDLPGTDPLPFAGEAGKVGRMGFALAGAWDSRRPAASLRNALASSEEHPHRFATLESTIPFFVNQFRMQLRKRRG